MSVPVVGAGEHSQCMHANAVCVYIRAYIHMYVRLPTCRQLKNINGTNGTLYYPVMYVNEVSSCQ